MSELIGSPHGGMFYWVSCLFAGEGQVVVLGAVAADAEAQDIEIQSKFAEQLGSMGL